MQNTQANENNREIVITGTFSSPRERVWEAWTNPEQIVKWWGPNGFTNTLYEMDVKPGGTWRHMMHGPDGTDYPNRIVWQEIVPPERIVFIHGKSEGDSQAFVSTVTLVERGRQTEVILRSVFKTKEQRDDVVERYGAIEGGRQTLAHLAAYVAKLAAERS